MYRVSWAARATSWPSVGSHTSTDPFQPTQPACAHLWDVEAVAVVVRPSLTSAHPLHSLPTRTPVPSFRSRIFHLRVRTHTGRLSRARPSMDTPPTPVPPHIKPRVETRRSSLSMRRLRVAARTVESEREHARVAGIGSAVWSFSRPGVEWRSLPTRGAGPSQSFPRWGRHVTREPLEALAIHHTPLSHPPSRTHQPSSSTRGSRSGGASDADAERHPLSLA